MSAHDAATPSIDLNADVGEGHDDAALVPLVTSVSVACGAHAGDEATMRATIRIARAHGVAVGAHPSYPDRAGFGRQITTRDPAEIALLVAEQVARFLSIARDEGATLAHVKPHGALYNLSAVNPVVAAAIADAVARVAPGVRLVGLAGSCSLTAAFQAGLRPVGEAFPDRGYLVDATLAPRDRAGASIEDATVAAQRAVRLATTRTIETLDGTVVRVAAQSLCLHGDTPDAPARAAAVRAALLAAGVRISAGER